MNSPPRSASRERCEPGMEEWSSAESNVHDDQTESQTDNHHRYSDRRGSEKSISKKCAMLSYLRGYFPENLKKLKTIWKENHAWPVFCSTLVVSILLLNFGITVGYATPAIPDLQTDDKDTSINDTSTIFSALVPFGAVVSGPIAGIFLDAFGRHVTLMICVIPFTIGWLLIMLTRLVNGYAFLLVLYTGRFFTGFGLGWANAGVPCYVAELSPSALRGLFGGGFFSIFISSGMLLVQLCGIIPGATYYWLPVVPLITLLIYVVFMPFTMETPRWLVKARRIKEARSVLLCLRGNNYDIDKELKEIRENFSKEKNQHFFEKFRHRSTFVPLIFGCCLTSLPRLGGITAVVFYSQVIFHNVKAVSDIADVLAAFCTGGAHLAGGIVFLLFIDKVGRRKLLLLGAITMCVSAGTMGVYYVFNSKPYCDPDEESNKCVDSLTPIAIVSILVYCFSFSLGWGSLPYLVAAELLPLHARGAGTGVVTCASWLAATVLLLAYEPYQELVNPWGAFFTFSIIMFIALLFVYKFIPETKGKTLEEIQCFFSKTTKSIDNLDSNPPTSNTDCSIV